MSITPSEVKHIAHLARLELTDDEIAHYSEQLSAILDYFTHLQSLDAAFVTSDETALPTPLRPDVSRPSLDREQLLRNASVVENEQFRVPPVFE